MYLYPEMSDTRFTIRFEKCHRMFFIMYKLTNFFTTIRLEEALKVTLKLGFSLTANVFSRKRV